ncbi:MAG: hypothetical protein NTZ32_06350 [Planctomycetales bacterium]|nr:hypothetical protein [Planctomycetales bacterium]
MNQLLTSLQSLLVASWDVVLAVLMLVSPWTPLLAWVAFWMLAVNWVKLREVMIRGGWIGVVLMGLVMVLIWAVVAPPENGLHHLFGLKVSNLVGKTVYVTSLLTILFLCGAVQLSGACGSLAHFEEDAPEEDDHHSGHGDDSHEHDGHGHVAEAHDAHAHAH